jgi:AcrR family transcriptional regulator
LEAVTNDLEQHGLVGFTLRRAARAADTTHKVLIYHFGDVDELMRQALTELRRRRIAHLTHATDATPESTLADRVRAVWDTLLAEPNTHRVLDQATGLALFDPVRYERLGREATDLYLPALHAICPPHWEPSRRADVAQFILAALRGLLVDHLTNPQSTTSSGGLHVLLRALHNEEHMRDKS